jgi:hypothetical protein
VKKIALACVLGLTFLSAQLACAQGANYPNRQIKIISPFATGGIADGFSRLQGIPEETNLWMGEPLADTKRATHSMAFCFAGAPPGIPIDTILWLQDYEVPKDKE